MKAISLIILLSLQAYQFQAQISFRVFDSTSKDPIKDVHVFIANSTFGTTSDTQGNCIITVSSEIHEDLILSHISYESRTVSHSDYSVLTNHDSLFLNSNGFDLAEITISSKRSSTWKKNYKTFEKNFLGPNKKKYNVKILNPEVLRFKQQDGNLFITAVDLIKIHNPGLGYNINFMLTEMAVEKSGSSKYRGFAKFTSFKTKSTSQLKNRIHEFESSPRHFFRSLVRDSVEEHKYKMYVRKYKEGQFLTIATPSASTLVKLDTISTKYFVQFPEFLEVQLLNIQEYVETSIGNVPNSSLESTRFNNSQGGTKMDIKYAASQLYKLSPYLVVDYNGHVFNPDQLQEFGYWAQKKISNMLPWDYRLDDPIFRRHINALSEDQNEISIRDFKKLVLSSEFEKSQVIIKLDKEWKDSYSILILDLILLLKEETTVQQLIALLEKKTIITEFKSYYDAIQLLWDKEINYPDYYGDFKAFLYKYLDPKFETYFKGRQTSSKISMDEILWGGVKQDGIPPLRFPKLLNATDENYLADGDIVFGIAINGIAKAYPKRILAWHEFFVDNFGDIEVAGAFCTLCGTIIPYQTNYDDKHHSLGTSGFLYRSNKLMYDAETQSLWNTISGEPVIGPLVNKGIKLKTFPVTTTSWGIWKKTHPKSMVLDIDTGYKRNYDEGEAYKEYYATDRLMFPVLQKNDQLRNKDEVFVIRGRNYEKDPVAIAVHSFKNSSFKAINISGENYIVLKFDDNRMAAYESRDIIFHSFKNGVLVDGHKNHWEISHDYLKAEGGLFLNRVPTHRIFWFAWINSYPNTRLIK